MHQSKNIAHKPRLPAQKFIIYTNELLTHRKEYICLHSTINRRMLKVGYSFDVNHRDTYFALQNTVINGIQNVENDGKNQRHRNIGNEKSRLFCESDLFKNARFLLVPKHLKQRLPDLARFLTCVNALPNSGGFIVSNNRRRLGVVRCQSLLQRVLVIVRAMNQGFASDIVLHLRLWRIEDLVVRPTRRWVNESSSNAGD